MDVKKKVLIVEDEDTWQEIYQTRLSEKDVDVVPAYTPEDAEIQFAVHYPALDAIVVDAELGPASIMTSSSLVRGFRQKGYKGPLIAASASTENCEVLTQAGCDYTIAGNKELTIDILSEVLQLA